MDEEQFSEKDIEVALRYLKYHDSENATREKAIALLTDLQEGYHHMAHTNPELLEELQKAIQQEKKSES